MSRSIAALAVSVAFLTGRARAGERPLTVAAAANVRPALEEIRALWEKTSGAPVTISYGASGILARQIEQGAPFDLFLSADAGFVAGLESKGLILPGSRAPYAIGALVLVAAKGRPAIVSIQDLSNPVFARISIAHPETAPYGRAAMQCLEKAGLAQRLGPRLVSAETVRDALRYVETGDADAGFAAESEARGSGLAKYTIPKDLYAPIRQELAVMARSPRARDATALSEFLRSSTAREIWTRYGYGAP